MSPNGHDHPAPLTVIGPETVSMTTPDGVRLDADLYRPAEGGPYPVLLMRQPYGRRIASTVVFAHPRWYAAQGYIVAIQDVRGAGTSEGTFRAFEAEQADGAATVAWAAALPGSNGKVGMYGFSYQGMTQLLALAGGAPALAALAPTMVAWDIRDHWAYEGGAFALAGGIGWGLQMAALQAARAGDEAAFRALSKAAHAPPLDDETPAWPDVLKRHRQYGHFADWIGNPAPGGYWDRVSPGAALAGHALDVPMLHIGGWYDQMLPGTLETHAQAVARSSKPQALVIGPWPHLPWGRRAGAVDFGPGAGSAIDRLQAQWFAHHLKGEAASDAIAPGLSLFDLTAQCWRRFPDWPAPHPRPLSLASQGLAAATQDDGRLSGQPGTDAADWFVHDPWRPVPSLGGHDGAPAGMQDRAALDGRADVACYTSAPMERETLLAGRVELDVWVDADAPSFDLSATLSVVTPDGRALVLTQGYRRIEPGEPLPLRISLRATCATLFPGHALRLSVAGASFPAHPVNPGTGQGAAETRAIDCRIITLGIRSGGDTPSCLWLPVVG